MYAYLQIYWEYCLYTGYTCTYTAYSSYNIAQTTARNRYYMWCSFFNNRYILFTFHSQQFYVSSYAPVCISLFNSAVSSDCILFWILFSDLLLPLSPSRCYPRPPLRTVSLCSAATYCVAAVYLYIYTEYLYRINYVHLQRKQILNVKLAEEIHTVA